MPACYQKSGAATIRVGKRLLPTAGTSGRLEPMQMSREEVDEMLRWADEVRRKLRRATRELAQLGDDIFRAREGLEPKPDDDRSR